MGISYTTKHAHHFRERKRQREREENWKTLQRKVSGTIAVAITTSADEDDFYNFSFPTTSDRFDQEEDPQDELEDFDIMTDEETDAELEHQQHQQEEQHDMIHPDMVSYSYT